MKSAFKNLPIRPEDRRWLVLKATHPIMGVQYYFIDKCMPFGSSISCSHFQRVSNAIHHIFKVKTKNDPNNYLDDFLFIKRIESLCNELFQKFIDLCGQIEMPIAPLKT